MTSQLVFNIDLEQDDGAFPISFSNPLTNVCLYPDTSSLLCWHPYIQSMGNGIEIEIYISNSKKTGLPALSESLGPYEPICDPTLQDIFRLPQSLGAREFRFVLRGSTQVGIFLFPVAILPI